MLFVECCVALLRVECGVLFVEGIFLGACCESVKCANVMHVIVRGMCLCDCVACVLLVVCCVRVSSCCVVNCALCVECVV